MHARSPHRPRFRWWLAVALAALLAVSSGRSGLEAQEGPTAGEPKNVKILTGKSLKEIRAVMKTFTRGLGVKCNHCHVKDFSSDEKEAKQVARKMLQMLIAINGSTLEGKGTCYMCHRGQTEVERDVPGGEGEASPPSPAGP